MSFLKWIGSMSAGAGKAGGIGPDWPNSGNDRYFGLENYGNTCYCNSVVQALYFCRPFRECVQVYSYPTSAALLTAAAENIPFPTPTPLKTASSTSSLNGYFSAEHFRLKEKEKDYRGPVSHSDKDKPPKGEKKRKESASTRMSLIGGKLTHSVGGAGIPPLVPAILEGMDLTEADKETLLSGLQELFLKITTQKKKTGIIGPQQFITILKRENELFRGTMHQDAHEMLNYLLNAIAEILLRHKREMVEKFKSLPNRTVPASFDAVLPPPSLTESDGGSSTSKRQQVPESWVHALFEGILTNETKCLTCETVTSRDETFLDLSVDVEPHCSLSYCLRNFSKSETLCHKNKFFCDVCNSLQEAEKRMILRKTPNILAVHLKRFKYQEQLQRYIKLSYRVPFPLELRLSHFTDDAENPERLYQLFAVIVHIGGGPHHGHYVTLVKSSGQWLLFDDDDVTPIEESELHQYYGDNNSVGSGYIFFYMAEDFDANELIQSMQYLEDHVAATSGSNMASVAANAVAGAVSPNGDLPIGTLHSPAVQPNKDRIASVTNNSTPNHSDSNLSQQLLTYHQQQQLHLQQQQQQQQQPSSQQSSIAGAGSTNGTSVIAPPNVVSSGLSVLAPTTSTIAPPSTSSHSSAAESFSRIMKLGKRPSTVPLNNSVLNTTPPPPLPFAADTTANNHIVNGIPAAASQPPSLTLALKSFTFGNPKDEDTGTPTPTPATPSAHTAGGKESWGWFGIGKKEKDKERDKEKEKK